MIGDKSVGKTSIVQRYTDKKFSHQTESTIGTTFCSKILQVQASLDKPSVNVKLQLWDTAGEEKFRAVTPMYYRGASAVVLVYDSTDEITFQALERWLKEIE